MAALRDSMMQASEVDGYSPFKQLFCIEVGVIWIEQSRIAQGLKIVNLQISIPQRNESRPSQLLQRAIEMHGREAGRVDHVHLGNGKGKYVSVDKTHYVQPEIQFTDQMCHSFERVATSKIDR